MAEGVRAMFEPHMSDYEAVYVKTKCNSPCTGTMEIITSTDMKPIKFPSRTVTWGLPEYAGVFIYAAIAFGAVAFFIWMATEARVGL